MIDLNEHAQKAQEIAFNRWKKKDVDYHTPAMLKHCAGEVCEAVEAYDQYLYEYIESNRNKLAAELADIITCALIAAANEDIDIEKALKDCQQKNEARAMEGSK